jgi:hypothetical protein
MSIQQPPADVHYSAFGVVLIQRFWGEQIRAVEHTTVQAETLKEKNILGHLRVEIEDNIKIYTKTKFENMDRIQLNFVNVLTNFRVPQRIGILLAI